MVPDRPIYTAETAALAPTGAASGDRGASAGSHRTAQGKNSDVA